MKKFSEYLKAFFISWEFITIILGYVLYAFFSSKVDLLASSLVQDKDILKFFALLPSGFFVWILKEAKDLLFPGEENDKIMNEWPDYWRLKVHFNVSILFSIFFAFLGALILIFGLEINSSIGFLLLLTSIIGGLIVGGSVYFAKIKQKEILTTLNKPHKK